MSGGVLTTMKKGLIKITCLIFLITPFYLLAAESSLGSGGLPGTVLLDQRWRDMNSLYSPLTNPALLTEINYLQYRGAFAPVLWGEFTLAENGITLPLGLFSSAGLTVVNTFEGKLSSNDFNIDGAQQITEGAKNSSIYIFGTYATNIWRKLSIGGNLQYTYMSGFNDPITSVGLDVGATYRLFQHPFYGTHLAGFSTINAFTINFEKSGMSLNSSTSLSRDLKLMLASKYWDNQIESAFDLDIKDFLSSTDAWTNDSGLSIPKDLNWYLNAKVGGWIIHAMNVYAQCGLNKDALDYIGVAFGFNLPSFNNGRDFSALYQFNLMTGKSNEAYSHTGYVRCNFGKHREEIFARKMARLSSLSPNELYNKARKLYAEQNYWDAFFIFSRIAADFPDFFKNDWVKFFRASCQEELDMREMSFNNYEAMKKEYPISVAIPHADLGIMRIYYRNNEFGKVASQYTVLTRPNIPDSIRYHATYLMGQTHLQNNEISNAIELFNSIPENHPDYIFAQHGLAVANARLNNDISTIITALENCVGSKAQTPAQKEIVNRSYVFLGYIFYEENILSKAVIALRMVPTNSHYAEDALLGQAWTALKARQWNDCIASGQLLTKTTDKEILKCEGMLVQAYGHLLQKDYPSSLDLLKSAVGKIKELSRPNTDSLNLEQKKYESTRLSYQLLSEKVDNISQIGQTALMLTQVDSMHVEQQSFAKKIDDYYDYSENFNRTSFFSRSLDEIRNDIEYALATVQKIIGKSGAEKAQQKMEDKQKDIDKEIEKLQQEMKELQKNNE